MEANVREERLKLYDQWCEIVLETGVILSLDGIYNKPYERQYPITSITEYIHTYIHILYVKTI